MERNGYGRVTDKMNADGARYLAELRAHSRATPEDELPRPAGAISGEMDISEETAGAGHACAAAAATEAEAPQEVKRRSEEERPQEEEREARVRVRHECAMGEASRPCLRATIVARRGAAATDSELRWGGLGNPNAQHDQ